MGFVWIVAAAFLMWLLQGILYQKLWDRGLDVRLEFSSDAVLEGETGSLKEIVENRKWLPLPVMQVGFAVDRSLEFVSRSNVTVSDQAYRRDIFALFPYQQIVRTLEFHAKKRGYYPCAQLELVGKDLFFEGMHVKKKDSSAALYVYPKEIEMDQIETVCQEMLGEFFWKKKLYEDPFAFQEIRDYEVWDGFRQVNWKASARTGGLKVNVYENTALPRVQILLNLEQEEIWEDERLTENVIRIGAALARQWISQGIAAAVYTNGTDCLTGEYGRVEAGAGTGHLTSVLQMLSRVQAADERTSKMRREQERIHGLNPLWNCDSTQFIVYVSAGQNEENRNQLRQCADQGAGVLWIHPVLETQYVENRNQVPYMQWRIEK